MKAPARMVLASKANNGLFTPYQASFCIDSSLNRTKSRGRIIVCKHSGNPSESRIAKSLEVKRVKGVGMILIDEQESDLAIPFVLPASIVGRSIGKRIVSYAKSKRKAVSFISPARTVVGSRRAPRVAAFSSKGPNSLTAEILKPDIVAPGLNILAAWSPANDKTMKYNILSGTSMSCPHVTGLVALIKAMYPSWSPASIKSALLTTATILDNGGKAITAEPSRRPANPFDFGSGYPSPSRFLDPGLIYDAQTSEYVNFLCSIGYDSKKLQLITGDKRSKCIQPISSASNLNYPSITIPSLKRSCSVSRTVTNVGNPRSIYRAIVTSPKGVIVTVVPTVLNFKHYGQEKSFSVNFKAVVGSKDYVFGSLIWKSEKNSVRSPLVVKVASS